MVRFRGRRGIIELLTRELIPVCPHLNISGQILHRSHADIAIQLWTPIIRLQLDWFLMSKLTFHTPCNINIWSEASNLVSTIDEVKERITADISHFRTIFFSWYLISKEPCFPPKYEPMFVEVKEAAYTSRGGNFKLERPAPAILQGLRDKEAKMPGGAIE